MNKSNVFWQAYLNLENELIEVSKYIFFTEKQLDTFSPYIAELLVQCCVQIESIAKELYFGIEGDQRRGDTSLLFDTDCLKSIDIKWKTHDKIVMVVAPFFNFTKQENKELTPLKKAHNRGGTYWERHYQAVKHDRYNSLHLGNVKAVIHALAALYLLNLYLRNDSWKVTYNDISKIDYSVGSKIFAVKPPVAGELWYGNMPIQKSSPYIVQYQEVDYQNLEKLQYMEKKRISEYIRNQKEWNENEFLENLDLQDRNYITIFTKLAKYRLGKKIPDALPFSEKKDRLINSTEWNSEVWQRNKRTQENEITEENIYEVMDNLARDIGADTLSKVQGVDFINFATQRALCNIEIPKN